MEAKQKENIATEIMSLRKMQAQYCLNLLQMAAMQKRTVNYESLALMMGLPSKGNALAQAISTPLYDVFEFCKKAGLPHLTVLVVRKSGRDKDLPGPGFWKAYTQNPDKDEDGYIPSLNERIDITEEETVKCFRLFEQLGV